MFLLWLIMRKNIFLFCLFLFSFFLTIKSWSDLSSDTIYLTWKGDPTTTMTVQWISSLDQRASVVFYREKNQNRWFRMIGETSPLPFSSKYFIHSVELTALQPATEYIFKIITDAQEYLFQTMPADLHSSIQFVEGGDMYHDEIAFVARTCQEAAKHSPDFALLGGDIAYAVSSARDKHQDIERWITWIKNWHSTMVTPQGRLIPVLSAIGNHDLIGHYDQTLAQAALFKALFPSSNEKTYRTVDFGNYLSLFILDSGHAQPIGGEQTRWLHFNLKQRLNISHRFAVYHVPAYPAVRPFHNKQSVAIRRFWVPFFERGNIQLAFEHHDHAYKRTHPLLHNRIHSQGVIYLGDGGWGVEKMRQPRKHLPNKMYIAQSASERHFIQVILTPFSQIFKVMTDQGELIDRLDHFLQVEESILQN